jgi:hypothetical protein
MHSGWAVAGAVSVRGNQRLAGNLRGGGFESNWSVAATDRHVDATNAPVLAYRDNVT